MAKMPAVGRRRLWGMAAAVLLASGCASSRQPLRLQILTRDLSLTPGGERRVEGVVTNTGKADFKFQEGFGLIYLVTCRTSANPLGEWGLARGSGILGGVYGGITDRAPDPSDPFDCRANPPRVAATLRAGESLPLAVAVQVPGRCVEGEAELSLSFRVPYYGRKCPGFWDGEIGKTSRRVSLRHAGSGARPRSTPLPRGSRAPSPRLPVEKGRASR